MKLLSISLAVVLAFTTASFGQKGDLFLTHHTVDLEGLDHSDFGIKFNAKGQMCIANRSGILFYDGTHWEHIETPSAAVSIDFDTNDNLFVGCVGDFGVIDLHERQYKFVSLNPNDLDDGIYAETVYSDSSIFFMSEENLLRYHVNQKKLNLMNLDGDEYYNNLFVIDSTLQVQTSDSLYEYRNDSLVETHLQIPDSASFIFFNRHPTRERYVAGTTDNRTYIYRKGQFFQCKISDFLRENESFVVDGQWLNWKYFALSTLENGAILYDNRNSRIVEVINQHHGLPDNQVQAIGVDKEEGLWMSHDFGLTRMEINIPFRDFTNFQGLRGKIFEVFFYKRNLYVATSEGVFHLTKEDIYESVIYYVEKKSKRSSQAPKEVAVVQPEPSKKNKRKKGLLGRVFQKETKVEAAPVKITASNQKSKKSYERRVRKKLVESRWVFKQIEGLQTKTDQFIVYKGKLLAAGISGIYMIEDEEAELVIHEPIRFVTHEKSNNRLIIGTLYNEIKLYDLQGDVWVETDDLDFHDGLIMTAFHDQSGRTWFVTPNALLEFYQLSEENTEHNSYRYKNEFIDNAKLAYIDRQLYLINSEGYFYLHTGKKEMVEDTTLMRQIGKPVKHLQQRNGIIWVFNGENWYMIHRDKKVELMAEFGLFPDMSYISMYGNTHWLIQDAQEILQYVPAISDSLMPKNKMFFKRVTSNKGEVRPAGKLEFEHDDNNISFEMSKPDYRGILNPEYQYKLAGLHTDWTQWSDKSSYSIVLPIGNYKLHVRSRDAFGNIEEAEPISVIIHPPFWQTLWFNGLQILFMTALVFSSIALNRRAKTKYVIITEGMTILTIVLVIEFLQTAASSYLDIQSSPLVDFGLNVLIALCVFPLEQFLKKVMKAEKTGPGISGKGFLDFIKPGEKNKATDPSST